MHTKRISILLTLILCGASLLAAETPAQTRAAFLKVIDRPRVPLAADFRDMPDAGDLLQIHFSFASDAEQRVPGIFLRPLGDAKRPVVIVMHGTGGKKEGQLALMKKLCEKGFATVAIDGRYHGERTKIGSGDAEYCEAIHRAYTSVKEHPFYYDTVWDVMRLIDYLESRPDIDPKRIGLIGFSKGGIETYFASAADPRIAVAIPCIGVQSFKFGLDHDGWKARLGTIQKAVSAIAKDEGAEISVEFAKKFFDRLVPGIYAEFDGPAMLTLIAPRPLLVINGDSDKNTPLEGVKLAAESARAAYKAAEAEDRFVLRVQENTVHAVTPESQQVAIDWFVKWLRP